MSSSEIGPGYYQVRDSFGEGLGPVTFQEKRDNKVAQGPGPGEYSPDKCDSVVKAHARHVDFVHSTGRKSIVEDSNIGPGAYKHSSSFDNLPSMTI